MTQISENSSDEFDENISEVSYQENGKNQEKLEGMDSSEELMRDYPLDALLIRSETRTVHEICRRIKQGLYIMNPDFQRDFIWPPDKQSRLIESLLIRIPIPVFYLAERYDGKIVVIDGLQRLTTISNFLNNEFALRHLDAQNPVLSKKYFKDLSPKLQTRLEDTQLIIYILDEKVPDRAKLDIFERVNSGVPLSRQQMRNCMYSGKSTKMLSDLAKEMIFINATGHSLNRDTMRDREFINRFMAFYVLGIDSYRGDMDQFCADALSNINELSHDKIKELEDKFKSSMEKCYDIWGEHCFRRHTRNEQQRRNVINAALFDVLSIKMVHFPYEFENAKKDNIRQAVFNLFENREFVQSITYSTNSLKQVKTRFAMVEDAFKEV